jgi:hypothetical protein
MPQFIYREAPDVDYYVAWSSVVEAPTFTGTRAEMLTHLQREADPYLREDAPHHPERRLDRADATGTTSLWVETAGMRDKYPEDGAWDDDTYIYQQQGVLTRAGLFELCHRLDADAQADVSDLLRPFEDNPDVATIEIGSDDAPA